jgi:class 3 adenylate cyclase
VGVTAVPARHTVTWPASRDGPLSILTEDTLKLPFDEYLPVGDSADDVFENVERFARRIRADEAEFDRVLATVLFTDIVDSTAKSAAMGDRAWGEIRDRHDQLVRVNLARFRGREIKDDGGRIPRDLRWSRPRGPVCRSDRGGGEATRD